MIEEWRDIPGYDGLYSASNLGHVKSRKPFRKRNENILKGRPDAKKYLRVILYKNQGKRQFKIHHLVLKSFGLPRPSLNHECRHLDGDPQNNCLDNLRWGTAKENSVDKIIHNRTYHPEIYGENHAMAKLKNEDVLFIRNNYRPGNGTELSKRFNVTKTNISRIIKRKIWKDL